MMKDIILVFMFLALSNSPKAVIFVDGLEVAQSDLTESKTTADTCNLTIDESTMKEVFKIMNHRKVNAVELNVRIESYNYTFGNTSLVPGITWTNEMGRTLISLIGSARSQSRILLSYTSTLTTGVAHLNVVVSKEPEECSIGYNISDIVFEFLLHQLYRNNEDGTDNQLCRNKRNDQTIYSCCGLYGQTGTTICADYSSALVTYSNNLFTGALYLFVFIAFPLSVNHIRNTKKESDSYKISDSPMSLSFLLHIMFIKGHGPLKCFIRKLLIITLVLLMTIPVNNLADMPNVILLIVLLSWALLFLFFDERVIHEESHYTEYDVNPFRSFAFLDNSTRIIALPFNLKFLRNIATRSNFVRKHLKLNLATNYQQTLPTVPQVTERTGLLGQQRNNTYEQSQRSSPQRGIRYLIDLSKYCLSITLLLMFYIVIGLPILCLFSLGVLVYRCFVHAKIKRTTDRVKIQLFRIRSGKAFLVHCVRFLTLGSLMYCFATCYYLMFFFMTGLYLNIGYYSVYVVPLTLIVFYSWTCWKSSVEEKYLELNAKIYNVCKKNTPIQVTRRFSIDRTYDQNSDDRINPNSNDTAESSTGSITTRRFLINLDENGEPLIPKQLYDIVREKFLPYDEVLFNYFQGIFFVAIYAYFLYIMMSLAQVSGVSDNAQIISTLTASSLPYMFDVVWKKQSEEQKATNSLVLKSKLNKVLSVRHFNSDTGEIEVEFTGAPATIPLVD